MFKEHTFAFWLSPSTLFPKNFALENLNCTDPASSQICRDGCVYRACNSACI